MNTKISTLTVYCQELTLSVSYGLVNWKVDLVIYVCSWVSFSVVLKCCFSEAMLLEGSLAVKIYQRDIMRKSSKDIPVIFVYDYIIWGFFCRNTLNSVIFLTFSFSLLCTVAYAWWRKSWSNTGNYSCKNSLY